MNNTNRNFKGQQENEIVECFTRRHWVILVPYFLGFFIFFGLLILFFLTISRRDLNTLTTAGNYRIVALIFLVSLTYWIHKFFIRVFNYYLQVFIVTNFRIVQLEQTLYFNRQSDSTGLAEIQDITIQQNGILKTILNYGELNITLSSSQPAMKLRYTPNPEYYFRKINKVKGAYVILQQQERGRITKSEPVGEPWLAPRSP